MPLAEEIVVSNTFNLAVHRMTYRGDWYSSFKVKGIGCGILRVENTLPEVHGVNGSIGHGYPLWLKGIGGDMLYGGAIR